MAIHLVTFATDEYLYSAINLRHNALLNGIDYVYIYTPNDIKNFINNNKKIFEYKKGYGCYAWQPYILLDRFNKIKENDIIIYCDAGINFTKRVDELINLCKKYSKCFFYVGEFLEKNYKNIYWTKSFVFEKMKCNNDKYYNSYQVMGGFQIYIKNDINYKFIKEFMDYCSDYELITDIKINGYENNELFKEHRHNQSILTNLVKKYNIKVFRDPSQFGLKDKVDDSNYGMIINIHRQKLNKLLKVAIITPTIGSKYLDRCINSIQKQSYINIEHIVVIDGIEYKDNSEKILNKYKNKNELTIIQLPKNTGKNRWNGHKIYGSIPFLCDADYICYLDEDNWFDNIHIETLLKTIFFGNLDWAFSLRKIVDKEGNFITNDNCENLGNLSSVFNNNNDYLVDTSCYMIKKDIAIKLSYTWNSQARDLNKMEVDRYLFSELNKLYPKYGSNLKYTVNYMVENQEHSVNKNFFIEGNKIMYKKYNNKLPWDNSYKKDLYIIHFNKNATIKYLNLPYYNKNVSYAFDNWQMSLLNEFHKEYNLKNAYTETIPKNSIVLINICNPHELPKLLERNDIIKICYTAEGPNIRHQLQWNYKFLKKYFTHVLTYYKPLLIFDKNLFKYCPFLHRLDFNNKIDKKYILKKNIIDRSICFVGENRNLSNTYEIDGIKLQCLDKLRELYINNLKDIVIYGNGWDNNIKKGTIIWGRNDGYSINIFKNYTFCLIIENCNAPGYVSEKIYDVWCSGGIPLYYGNIDKDMEIPNNMFIDLKLISPYDLQKYLNNLTDSNIDLMIKNIELHREKILKKVSPIRYYQIFRELIND